MPVTACSDAMEWTVEMDRNSLGVQIPKTMMNRAHR
jgi:hypothetical protein